MGTFENIKDDLLGIIRDTGKETTSGYDSEATVIRTEGDTAWVHIPGGVDETPVAMTINAKAGDTVRIRVADGQAWINGNDTAPPTDDATANIARSTATEANSKATAAAEDADTALNLAGNAIGIASEAQQIAGDTAQHFWFTETGTDTGAHITEVTQEEFEAAPESGGGNLLARSNGIAVRDGLIELANMGTSGISLQTKENWEATFFKLSPRLIQITHDPIKYIPPGIITDKSATTPLIINYEDRGAVGNYYEDILHIEIATEEIVEMNKTLYTVSIGNNATCADNSVAIGEDTEAGSSDQFVIGHRNAVDSGGTYAFIIGNGSSLPQRFTNALAVAWDGETELALDTTAASGTDYDLYTAISSLGWTSDVIV